MQYKSPGVYIEEKNTFPNSTRQVNTAVPVFIGHTEKALSLNGRSLLNVPTIISSLVEYEQLFGKAPQYKFKLIESNDALAFPINGKSYIVDLDGVLMYRLYNSLRLFYANGGGRCYIVSAGGYNTTLTLAAMQAAIDTLRKEPEPTMLVVPDALLLSNADYNTLMNDMLVHCMCMQSCVAILDTYTCNTIDDDISNFRSAILTDDRSYGVAYYPWLNTVITTDAALDYTQFADLQNYMEPAHVAAYNTIMQNAATVGIEGADSALLALSDNYKTIKAAALSLVNKMPPSAAMAGVYTSVDNAVGVWKAPANVSLQAVASPVLSINNNQQEGMNVPLDGKAVNAIRSFTGRGLLVWGARTLDGNSNDWRYINVRRTMIMVEQSIKFACQAYVFEPNDANTWAAITASINSFLTGLWAQGAFAGAKPEEAFFVKIGLGSTMTSNDLLDGFLRAEVGVAITRPAEFIIITFQQQMQAS